MKLLSLLHWFGYVSWINSKVLVTTSFILSPTQKNYSHERYMSVPNALDTFTSGMASICRLPKGITAIPPDKLLVPPGELRILKLYDIENSRACRTVRERITELDLVVEKVIPATENSRAVLDKKYHDCLPPG